MVHFITYLLFLSGIKNRTNSNAIQLVLTLLPTIKMVALILNTNDFEVALSNMEAFAKGIFSGQDETQRLKLFEKLQNLSQLYISGLKSTPNKFQVESQRKMELPDEIWLKVIQYLPTNDMFENFALACKRLKNLTEDIRAVKYLQLCKINTDVKFEKALKVVKRSRGIKELKITKSENQYANHPEYYRSFWRLI